MSIRYRVEFRGAVMFVNNVELDQLIKSGIRRGISIKEFKITAYEGPA